jgi:hypothetical protein
MWYIKILKPAVLTAGFFVPLKRNGDENKNVFEKESRRHTDPGQYLYESQG